MIKAHNNQEIDNNIRLSQTLFSFILSSHPFFSNFWIGNKKNPRAVVGLCSYSLTQSPPQHLLIGGKLTVQYNAYWVFKHILFILY